MLGLPFKIVTAPQYPDPKTLKNKLKGNYSRPARRTRAELRRQEELRQQQMEIKRAELEIEKLRIDKERQKLLRGDEPTRQELSLSDLKGLAEFVKGLGGDIVWGDDTPSAVPGAPPVLKSLVDSPAGVELMKHIGPSLARLIEAMSQRPQSASQPQTMIEDATLVEPQPSNESEDDVSIQDRMQETLILNQIQSMSSDQAARTLLTLQIPIAQQLAAQICNTPDERMPVLLNDIAGRMPNLANWLRSNADWFMDCVHQVRAYVRQAGGQVSVA